jgi:hypothetical protein
MHQSNLPKLTFGNVSHGYRNLARGSKSGRRHVDSNLSPHKLNTLVKTRGLKKFHIWFFQFEFFGLGFQVFLVSFQFSMDYF